MKSRRQALSLCINAAVVVAIQESSQFQLKMFRGLEFLQIQQLAFKQAKEMFYSRIVQAVAFAAHALPNTLLTKYTLVRFMLVLPALVRVEDQPRSIRYRLKSLVQHGSDHIRNRPAKDGITDQITAVQIQDRRDKSSLQTN